MDGDNIGCKIHPAAAIFFRNRNAHQSEFAHFPDDFLWVLSLLHSFYLRLYFMLSEVSNELLDHSLLFCKMAVHFTPSLSGWDDFMNTYKNLGLISFRTSPLAHTALKADTAYSCCLQSLHGAL